MAKKKSSSKSKKSEKESSGEVSHASADWWYMYRNPTTEVPQSLGVLEQQGDRIVALQKKYRPQLAEAESDAATVQRRGDFDDVSDLGQYGRSILLSSNPELASSLGRLSSPTLLEDQLVGQASSDLALGGSLSSGDARDAVQTARAGMSARGLALTTPAVAAEVLNRDTLSRQRLAERQDAATSASELQQGWENTRFSAAQSYYDPFETVLGRGVRSTAADDTFSPTGSYFSTLNAGNQSAAVSKYEADTSANIASADNATTWKTAKLSDKYNRWSTIYNAGVANKISRRNRTSSLIGAGISALGSVAGGALSCDSRLKRVLALIGRRPDGIGVYLWRYVFGGPTMVGPVAQDVARVRPDAVVMGADGYLRVYLGAIGMRMRRA